MSLPEPQPRAASRRASIRPLALGQLLGNLLVIGTLAALAWVVLASNRDADRQRAADATEALVSSLQQSIAGELAQVDIAARHVAGAMAELGPAEHADAGRVARILADELPLVRAAHSIRIADTSGWLRHGTDLKQPVYIGDRELYGRLRDDAHAGMMVSEPSPSRVDGRWVLAIGRRLQTRGGDFAGVVFVNVDIEHFQRLLAGVDVGSQGAISLRSGSLRLIARHAGQVPVPGAPAASAAQIGSASVSNELAAAVRARPGGGVYVATTALDGIERANAYRRIGDYPLIVIAGLATEEFFASWRRQFVQVGTLIGLVAVLVALASWLVVRAWSREADSEDALVTEGRRNQALLRTASDGIHVLNRSGEVVELSESFARMLGRTRREVLGTHVTAWDASLSPEAIARWLESFEIGRLRRFETRHRRADGTLIDVEIQSTAIDFDHEVLIFCSARDISLLQEAQTQRIRTVELEAENRKLVETARMKALFLGNMSHELRTPLNAILGFAQLARLDAAADESAHLDRVEAAGLELLGLIDRLLMYSEAQAHPIPCVAQCVEAGALLAEVVDLHRADVRRKRQRLSVEVDPTLGMLWIDPLRLKQALANCLSNAVKFTPEGGSVALRARALGAHDVRIEIEDDGIGIAPGDLPRVFSDFSQLSEGPSKRYGGIGLGLALTRRIVEALGGTVGVSSTPGVGSCFHFELRAVRPRAPVAEGTGNASAD